MNKIYRMAAGMVLAISIVAPMVLADEGQGGPGQAPSQTQTPGGPGGGMWKQKLGLSDDQAAKLESAMKAHRAVMQPLREQQRVTLKTLGEQIKSNAGDSAVQATLDQLKALEKSVQVESEKFHQTLASFLTPTQQGKMLVGMMMHMGHHPPMGAQGMHGNSQGQANATESGPDGGGDDQGEGQ
jgi:Spy/CpxP family protein refolding chaperone